MLFRRCLALLPDEHSGVQWHATRIDHTYQTYMAACNRGRDDAAAAGLLYAAIRLCGQCTDSACAYCMTARFGICIVPR